MLSSLQEFQSTSLEEQAERRSRVRVLVITGFGLNCEAETQAAFEMCGASASQVHLQDILEGRVETKPVRLPDFSIIVFGGGFAFGDHLGGGFVFANKIRWRLYDQLLEFIEGGGLSLGICNGFQTMVRLGILPGLDGDYRTPRAALAPNERIGYRNAWVKLAFDTDSPCVWTRGLECMDLPSRHGEGRFLTESPALLERLEEDGLVAARYVDESGAPTTTWPANPNGSPGGVAGICDPSGRLFGLMPHPDAYLYPHHHPDWPRRAAAGELEERGAGLAIFQNGVDYVAASL